MNLFFILAAVYIQWGCLSLWCWEEYFHLNQRK